MVRRMGKRILRYLIEAVLWCIVEPLFELSDYIRRSNLPPRGRRRIRLVFEITAAFIMCSVLMIPAWVLSHLDEDW